MNTENTIILSKLTLHNDLCNIKALDANLNKNIRRNVVAGTPVIYQVPDLTQIMHIGRDKAYALMRSKAFSSIKIGSTYIVTKDKLEEWLNSVSGKDFKL